MPGECQRVSATRGVNPDAITELKEAVHSEGRLNHEDTEDQAMKNRMHERAI